MENKLLGRKLRWLFSLMMFLILSCSSNKKIYSYRECMNKSFLPFGEDFYGGLILAENKLLEIGAIEAKNKEGYLNAFKSLIEQNNDEWENHYVILKTSVLKKFEVNRFQGHFLLICSNIDSEYDKIKINSTYIQKYLFKQFVHKSFDNTEILDGLFLFTDFNDDSLRHHITYLLLLNLEEKYGQKE